MFRAERWHTRLDVVVCGIFLFTLPIHGHAQQAMLVQLAKQFVRRFFAGRDIFEEVGHKKAQLCVV